MTYQYSNCTRCVALDPSAPGCRALGRRFRRIELTLIDIVDTRDKFLLVKSVLPRPSADTAFPLLPEARAGGFDEQESLSRTPETPWVRNRSLIRQL